eukprot:5633920-Amphidinium_carterae.1
MRSHRGSRKCHMLRQRVCAGHSSKSQVAPARNWVSWVLPHISNREAVHARSTVRILHISSGSLCLVDRVSSHTGIKSNV